MEVEVGGSPVAFGDTISATGEMYVKSTQPYVLEVDDVVWSPISSSNGVDTFLLSTSGTIKIFVDNTLVFYFSNSIVTDFEIAITGSRQYNGDAIVKTNYQVPSYNQDVLLSATNKIYLSCSTRNITLEDLRELPLSCNNGTIVTPTYSGSSVSCYVQDVVSNTYCAIFCGNVLIGFFTPAS